MARKPKTDKDGEETITCFHCRYERPAVDAHCHLCGWPWPWIEQDKPPQAGKARSHGGSKG